MIDWLIVFARLSYEPYLWRTLWLPPWIILPSCDWLGNGFTVVTLLAFTYYKFILKQFLEYNWCIKSLSFFSKNPSWSIIIQITVSLDPVHLQNKELFFTLYELWHGFNPRITIRAKLYCSITGLSKSLWHCCEGQLEKGPVESIFPKNRRWHMPSEIMTYRGRPSATFNKITDNRFKWWYDWWSPEVNLYANFVGTTPIDNSFQFLQVTFGKCDKMPSTEKLLVKLC